MGFVPQTSNVFVSMTVEENLEMGAYIRDDDFSDTMEQVFDALPDPASRSAASRRASSPAASASRSRSAAR